MAPVMMLGGARQTGKSTLVKALGRAVTGVDYRTFDDPMTLASVRHPEGFIADLPEYVILDEIQRAPEVFLAIKRSVDNNRKPGRFILTGSANVLVIPKLSDSLAGRMIIKTLWPLSQGELAGKFEDFIAAVFSKARLSGFQSTVGWQNLVGRIATGGFPEVAQQPDEQLRAEWFSSYLRTILERDVRDISNIDALRSFPRLISLLAQRASTSVNYADIGRLCEIAKTSLMRYVSLFETLFLTCSVPGWFRNPEKRLIKSPKLLFCDSGLLCHLRDARADALRSQRDKAGSIVENFVGMELVKQLSWSTITANLFHYRSRDGIEVDFVLEDDSGAVVGIEVKCGGSVGESDLKGLRHLQQTVGKKFYRGIVLYTGDRSATLAPDLVAMPISALWELHAEPSTSIFLTRTRKG
ncbi:MAG: ATP-binding protein [Candidatus Melainabacteria bacterium]|nr:ATP-binding protein [Candidatus Melainabacteria bacterium]